MASMAADLTNDEAAPEKPRPMVLCVDDDPDLLAAVRRSLKSDAYDLQSTLSPREALQVLAARSVNVIVSDFDMPEMSGIDLLIEARRVRPEAVRILLTGRGTMSAAVAGINEGEVFRFLVKPCDPVELRKAVLSAIERSHELAASLAQRDLVSQRAQLLRELESEFPGITNVARDPDGAYLHAPDRSRQAAAQLGLNELVALCDAEAAQGG
jgi:two-component system, probable response regulator PhcQ